MNESKKERINRRWGIFTRAMGGSVNVNDSSCGFKGYRFFQKSKFKKKEETDKLLVNKEIDIINDYQDSKYEWIYYICDNIKLLMKQRKLETPISLDELKSNDNTGNIRVWPSEEVLAYYITSNKMIINHINTYNLKEKQNSIKILEIGAGMSGLAGFSLLQSWNDKEISINITITDGNKDCINKINEIMNYNHKNNLLSDSMINNLTISQLEWQNIKESIEFKDKKHFYDIIIAADCVFLEEYHLVLLDLLEYLLKHNSGLFILLAPFRGGSRKRFKELALQRECFEVSEQQRYSENIWKEHEYFIDNLAQLYYEPLNHYPSLLLIRKK